MSSSFFAVDAAASIDFLNRQVHALFVGFEEGRLCLVAVDFADFDDVLRLRGCQHVDKAEQRYGAQ